MDTILTTLVAAVALGIAGQIIAERFQLPAILPLLVFGILCGPFGLGLVHPEALGDALEAFIHLGVAIILFEGGLSLDPQRLVKVGAAVRNLLTIGVVVTGIGAAALAHWIVDMPWATAALFGAIVTVTGPTVIVPLLRHMIAPREVKTILLSEGLIVDPIGAILAYIVLQWIQRAGIPFRALTGELLMLAATGIVLGFAAGALAKLILRTRVVGGELRNLSVLALLMVCYLVSEHQAPQSGMLAAVVMGFTISAAELPDLVSVRAFKGQLTTLIISMLFILLAAQLDLGTVIALGWSGLAVAVGLIILVRPLAVALSIWSGQLDLRGRTVIALTAPRGIVAAAVASLAAHEMGKVGIGGAIEMEGLVYLSILATGTWSTVGALVLPRILGYTSDPARRRAVVVGANALTQTLAQVLSTNGRTTITVDASAWRLDRFRQAGLSTGIGDARDVATYEEAGVERDSLVIAGTTNDELNLLVAELVRTEFGVEHPAVAMQRPPDDLGRRSRAWIDVLGGMGVDVPKWIRRIENRRASELTIDPKSADAVAALRAVEKEFNDSVIRLVAFVKNEPVFEVGDARLGQRDRLILLVKEGRPFEILEPYDMSNLEVTNETEKLAADNEPGAETP
ncbi:MAG: cation:proton antiporter [Acidobacteria bacterium]|uniref:Cation:proton antiporter n=1 Tax=Candidatus Sulfomarinibacter kjeldsenii TaxID=2885994 RepID=A0A8J6Y750_9BACT|nr:cation:proton antiporter [Candidatus Sulfomarinibacter kjeldsenii]MBD3870834.1 cation:proton antiporter [Candidatus Sulfomarinibacter kjeldsenii]